MGTQCWATKPCCRYQKHIILKSAKMTSKLHFVNIFGLTQFLQIKALIMPSSYSNSSLSNSPIILDSEASTIVISDSDDDSVNSSIFGFTCQICELRAGSNILVVKFNGTTGSIVVSMWLSGALLCIFLC